MTLRLDDLVILHGCAYPRCAAVIDKRFVGYCSLQCIDRGSVDLWYHSNYQRLPAGWIWPCMPGPRIRFQAAAGIADWSHRYVAVRGPLLDAWRREGLWPEAPLAWPDGVDVPRAFDGIHEAMRQEGAWGRRLAANRLEALLLALAAARGDPGEAAWLGKARLLLAEAPIPIDIPGIAGDCGLAPSTFRRRFAAVVGMSPRDYAISARMERARERLLSGHTPLATIAAGLGFADPSFFSRQFRRSTGLSPREYRASRQ
jgi:AraC family transcriptional regulator of arabinose operon